MSGFVINFTFFFKFFCTIKNFKSNEYIVFLTEGKFVPFERKKEYLFGSFIFLKLVLIKITKLTTQH